MMLLKVNAQILIKNLATLQRRFYSQDVRSICAKLNDETKNVIYNCNENGSLRIQLHNPSKRNAFNLEMYQSIGQTLRLASDHEQIRCVIFSGNNGFYSSGNDLSMVRNDPVKFVSKINTLFVVQFRLPEGHTER